ncbi:hypothetical protein ACOALA_03980 [Alicyclobacillus acidoterrestris]|uniref:hypothetical protein n=1 Tax=Alicyclobacillus acidoterrestris TaxID=1450 RepID=UPI003F5317A8
MNPPPEVAQWLTSHNMRIVPNDEYLRMVAEHMEMKQQIERVKEYCEALVQ